MKKHRIPLITCLTLATLSSLAACSSDGTSAKLSAKACDTAVEYSTAFSQAPRDPAEFGSYAKDTLVPLGDAFVENFTGKLAKPAKALQAAFVEIAETGDPSALESPQATAAVADIGSAVHEQCDLQAVTLSAVEYSFPDAPDTLKAGRVSFALVNKGVEDHEMVLFKRADGATESLEDILALPEDEMMTKLEFTGVTFGSPKTTNYVAVDLEPGTYFLLCFLPQGGGEDGPPHFMAGMKHTIEVA